MRAAEVSFIGALVYEHAWFGELLEKHLDFYDGLLPHLLLADVERWAESAFAHGSERSLKRLTRILQFLERGMAEGPEVSELVSVSFLEHLPRPGEAGAQLRELVGPACRAELEIIA